MYIGHRKRTVKTFIFCTGTLVPLETSAGARTCARNFSPDVCGGDAFLAADAVCGGVSAAFSGCTFVSASNYDANALIVDGSCWYYFMYGWCDCEGSVDD